MRIAMENKKIKKRMTKKEKLKYLKKLDNRKIIVSIVSFFTIILLVLLVNKTFFRKEYRNGNFKIDIPLFMYYYGDEDGTVTFKSIRKSDYLFEYFSEYFTNLENFDYYICNDGDTMYYDDETGSTIHTYYIKDTFGFKTIKIKYSVRDKNNVCG